nr:hypothetical protein [Cryobacterium aureum]
MAEDSFLKTQVEGIEAGIIRHGSDAREQRRVPIGVEDAVKDHVLSDTQAMRRRNFEQIGVSEAVLFTLVLDDPAEVVLAENGGLFRQLRLELLGNCALA